jgi:hypothetical protein
VAAQGHVAAAQAEFFRARDRCDPLALWSKISLLGALSLWHDTFAGMLCMNVSLLNWLLALATAKNAAGQEQRVDRPSRTAPCS